jgi:hypothetical protein
MVKATVYDIVAAPPHVNGKEETDAICTPLMVYFAATLNSGFSAVPVFWYNEMVAEVVRSDNFFELVLFNPVSRANSVSIRIHVHLSAGA